VSVCLIKIFFICPSSSSEVKAVLKKSRKIRAHNLAAAAAAAAAAADSPPPPGLAKSDDLALEFANSHTQSTE
jgi:hypothetical protein